MSAGESRFTPIPLIVGYDDEKVAELMVQWFFENYEDPAERTPFESAEGGYQFIWGVVDAREELEERFPNASDEARDKAVKEIEQDGWEWVPVPHPSDYE
jgi:hypothetical protein